MHATKTHTDKTEKKKKWPSSIPKPGHLLILTCDVLTWSTSHIHVLLKIGLKDREHRGWGQKEVGRGEESHLENAETTLVSESDTTTARRVEERHLAWALKQGKHTTFFQLWLLNLMQW